MKIGVFDSGIGGLAIAQAIEKALPDDRVVYVNDHEHIPYGDRTAEQLLRFVSPILQKLVDDGCRIIVIACNTVTTTIISELRQQIAVPLIGIEPMVKPAAENTKTRVIAVCATPATLKSERYRWLKETYAPELRVLEPDCRAWAGMIEQNEVNRQTVEDQINDVCNQGADVIVLGCTHYHWIEGLINQIVAGRAKVVQPETAIVARLKQVMASLSV